MYPNLAKAYPTNKLPDLRGEFIRGWDDGRGIDAGRTLLSGQDGTSFSHYGGNFDIGSGHSINNYDQIVSNQPEDFPVFHLQGLHEVMGLIM
nr:hypothetical protein OIPGGLEJ_00029 [Escherichia coli]